MLSYYMLKYLNNQLHRVTYSVMHCHFITNISCNSTVIWDKLQQQSHCYNMWKSEYKMSPCPPIHKECNVSRYAVYGRDVGGVLTEPACHAKNLGQTWESTPFHFISILKSIICLFVLNIGLSHICGIIFRINQHTRTSYGSCKKFGMGGWYIAVWTVCFLWHIN